MNTNLLLELAVELGYQLAMSGAETFRVEESVNRVLGAYGVESQVFALPNCLTVSIHTAEGEPKTHMRRIGFHGNDLDAVEKLNALSRRICTEKPDPEVLRQWLSETKKSRKQYSFPMQMLGSFSGAAGFCLFFGGTWLDFLFSGICGMIVGMTNLTLEKFKVNHFFSTIAASFLSALFAYLLSVTPLGIHADMVIIGALMILVPGLLITNAMRDIIFGDTNSGINRIVQVLLIAFGIALGTGAALSVVTNLFGMPTIARNVTVGAGMQLFSCLIGCVGFSILFNIHGPGGILCAMGGIIAWGVYLLTEALGGDNVLASFYGALAASFYAEIMARIRKYPAISYLVVSIFPLLPGAGVYYTMNYAVQGQMEQFAAKGMNTAAVAGAMAVGILLGSTVFRMIAVWKFRKK